MIIEVLMMECNVSNGLFLRSVYYDPFLAAAATADSNYRLQVRDGTRREKRSVASASHSRVCRRDVDVDGMR